MRSTIWRSHFWRRNYAFMRFVCSLVRTPKGISSNALYFISTCRDFSNSLFIWRTILSSKLSILSLFLLFYFNFFFSLSSFFFSSSFLHSSDPLHHPKPSNNHHSTKLQITNPTSKINHSKINQNQNQNQNQPLRWPTPPSKTQDPPPHRDRQAQAEIGKASSNPLFRSIPISNQNPSWSPRGGED